MRGYPRPTFLRYLEGAFPSKSEHYFGSNICSEDKKMFQGGLVVLSPQLGTLGETTGKKEKGKERGEKGGKTLTAAAQGTSFSR